VFSATGFGPTRLVGASERLLAELVDRFERAKSFLAAALSAPDLVRLREAAVGRKKFGTDLSPGGAEALAARVARFTGGWCVDAERIC